LPKLPSHVIAFDDAPFDKARRGDISIIGVAYAGNRLDGVMSGKIRRDGVNSTKTITALIFASRFHAHNQAIFLQGIALGGFNVIDLRALYDALSVPIIVVMRRRPNLQAIKRALLEHVPGGQRKWQLIENAGAIDVVADVFIQRMGINLGTAEKLIRKFAIHSVVPEPLRVAHLIAGGVTRGHSTGRV
jgi:uncharacterized protein